MLPQSERSKTGPCRLRAAVTLAAALVLLLPPATGQMDSPLKGQGTPGLDTTDVYISVYLDRLLEVDERNYRHQLIAYCYITWTDPSAHDTVLNTTAAWLAGDRNCQRECTDWAGEVACCDDIYMPTFFFRNVYGYPQDRAAGYKLAMLPAPNNSVAWLTFVHGIFHQPMDLTHFPFDSWDLLVSLEFFDTSTPDHPGVRVHTSSGGTSLYTAGKGDPVSQWGIEGISLAVNSRYLANPQQAFKMFSTVPSNPSDPLGLTTSNASLLRACRPGAIGGLGDARNITTVTVKIRISRFWSYHVLNTVLPVLLLGLLSFVVFFLERSDLSSRLGIIVTLFLAMAAVQFVISENQPASSYVLPTQQSAIATYVLLSLIAVESIVVYRIETWQERAAKRRVLWEARERHLAGCRAAKKAAVALDSGFQQDLPIKQEFAAPPASELSEAASIEGADVAIDTAAAAAGAASTVKHSGSWQRWSCWPRLQEATAGPRFAASSPLLEPTYDAWVSYCIDRCALFIFVVAYIVAFVLVFSLNSGYIDLFPLPS